MAPEMIPCVTESFKRFPFFCVLPGVQDCWFMAVGAIQPAFRMVLYASSEI